MRSSRCTLINYHYSASHKITTIRSLVVLVLLLLLLSAGVEGQQPSDSSVSSVSDNEDAYAWEGTNNLSPSIAIIVIVLVLGCFIIVGLAIYVQHCFGTSSSTLAPRRMNNNAIRGVDQSVISTFPVFEYSAVKELKIGKGALECAVCLSEFQEDETLRLLPKCDHVFHSHCIDAWLVGHTTCPVCRANLLVPDSDKALSDSLVSPQYPPTESSFEVQITIPEHEQTKSLPRNSGRFLRSHSTGHSLTQPGGNCERFTLRLPAEVRRQLMARTKLKRATSLVALPRQSSSRRGYRGGGSGEGSGSSKYGRFFGRPIMSRVGSFGSTVKVTIVTKLDQSFPSPLPV